MKTGIFLDLDGTILADNYTISDFDIFQVERLKKLGYKFYIVTGKTYNGSIDFYRQLKLDTPIIAYSGQVIYWPKEKDFGKEISSLKPNIVEDVIQEVSREYRINNFMIGLEKGVFYSKKTKESNLIRLVHKNDKILKYEQIPNNYEAVGTYIEIESNSIENLTKYKKILNQKYKDKVSFAFWQTDGNLPIIQFIPCNANKSESMMKVKIKEGLEKTIAFGNGWTDRDMLKQANIGYAMKNSANKIKAYADIITEFDNNNSGVGHELAKIKS